MPPSKAKKAKKAAKVAAAAKVNKATASTSSTAEAANPTTITATTTSATTADDDASTTTTETPRALLAFNIPLVRCTIYSFLDLKDLATCARLRRQDNWDDVVKLLYQCHHDPLVYWRLKKIGASKERIDTCINAIKAIDFEVGPLQDRGINWSARLEKGNGVMATYPNLKVVRVCTLLNATQSDLEYWRESFHLRRSNKSPGYVVEVALQDTHMGCRCGGHLDFARTVDMADLVNVKNLIRTDTACYWLSHLPPQSQMYSAAIRIKGHCREESYIPESECILSTWKQAAAKTPTVDTLLFTDGPILVPDIAGSARRIFKVVCMWPLLTCLTIPAVATRVAVDVLGNDGCPIPNLVRLEVDCLPATFKVQPGDHPKKSVPGMREVHSKSPVVGLLEALQRLAGHLPKLEHLNWPVEDQETVSALASDKRYHMGTRTSSPFPSLKTVKIGPFASPAWPLPDARQYQALLRPYLDDKRVTVTPLTWTNAEIQEFHHWTEQRILLANQRSMRLGLPFPLPRFPLEEPPSVREERLLRIFESISRLVNDDQGEVTDQRAEDWFKWYDWYPTFVREREAGRKAEEARRDARVAAKEPGWKVLLD